MSNGAKQKFLSLRIVTPLRCEREYSKENCYSSWIYLGPYIGKYFLTFPTSKSLITDDDDDDDDDDDAI